jgi:uncharacterized cupin superfamily protein
MTGCDELDVERLVQTSSTMFGRCVVDVEPGSSLDHQAALWRDAIVFVVAGEIELECSSCERHCFRGGDILSLARVPIRHVHNGGSTPARLLAIWRRTAVERITG